MDGWTPILNRILTQWRGFPAAQRAWLGVLAFAVVAGSGWYASISLQPRYELLLGGKAFSQDELTRTLEAFKSAGLTGHRVEGQRIMVLSAEVDRYTAAAVAQKALPVQFAAEFDRMQSRVNLFTSSEQRRELMEEARKTRLAQILRAIPEIEDAVVEWDRTKSTSLFRPQTQLAAHVSVRPRDGRELSLELVQSLKQFIAGALAGAKPEDVTVVDMNTSRVHGRRTPAEAEADRMQALNRQTTEDVTRQITQALAYIPEVLVSVNVELSPDEDLPESEAIDDLNVVTIRHGTRRANGANDRFGARSNRPFETSIRPVSNTRRDLRGPNSARLTMVRELERESFAEENAYHKSVQIVVTVPEDYYFDLARRRGVVPGKTLVADSEFRSMVANIKTESQRDIRDKLSRLLPLGTPPEAISITSYTRPGTRSNSNTVPETPATLLTGHTEWTKIAGWIFAGTVCAIGLLKYHSQRSSPVHAPASSLNLSSPHSALSSEMMNASNVEHPGTVNGNNLGALPDVRGATGHPPPEISSSHIASQVAAPAAMQPEAYYQAPHESRHFERSPSDAEAGDTSSTRSSNPYSEILAELADRERDTVIGAPNQTGVFEFLCQLTPFDTADFLRNEHPQTIALVATGLPTGRAAEVLHALPEALRWDVTQRISRMEPPAADVCREIAGNLAARLRQRQQSHTREQRQNDKPDFEAPDRPVAGSQPDLGPARNQAPGIPEIAGAPGRQVTKTSPRQLDHTQADTAVLDPGPVKFEDLCVLDRMSFYAVLRIVDAKSFAIALFDQTDPFKQKFLSLVPRTFAAAVMRQTRSLGPLRLSDISAAQIAIASVIWKLAQQKVITLPRHLIRQ